MKEDCDYLRFNRKRNFMVVSTGWDGLTINIVKDGSQQGFCLKADEAAELLELLQDYLEANQ